MIVDQQGGGVASIANTQKEVWVGFCVIFDGSMKRRGRRGREEEEEGDCGILAKPNNHKVTEERSWC